MKQAHQRTFKLALLLIFVFSMSSMAWAQEATPEATDVAASDPTKSSLSYSAPVNGEISNTVFNQTWTLQTASADRLNVRIERTGGNLIPDVSILDSNSQPLQTSYGSDRTGAAAIIEDFTLPAGGTYLIQVGRKDGEGGLTSGTYTLTVRPNATAEDNPNNTLVIGPIAVDSTLSGEITGAHWYARYSLSANAADVIQVRAERSSGTLFPEIEVLDSNGTVLQNGYVDYGGDASQIDRLELPSAGEYTVVVTRQSRFTGATVGKFDLSVTLLGAGEDNPILAPAAGNEVVYGQPLRGTINARWYEDWTLVTEAGDTLTLTVTSDAATSDVEGNLQPEVILLGGSGQELTHGYTDRDGASATIERYTLDTPGTYTVRASRAQGKTGQSSGPYTLTVTLEGSGVGSAALESVSGTVELDSAVEGQVTNVRWADSWTFTGEADQIIDILVERTEGTLIPLLAILDSNGQPLTSAYYEQTWDRAIINRYTIPSAGAYTIVVSRDGEQSGYTSGSYSLLVRLHSDE